MKLLKICRELGKIAKREGRPLIEGRIDQGGAEALVHFAKRGLNKTDLCVFTQIELDAGESRSTICCIVEDLDFFFRACLRRRIEKKGFSLQCGVE